MYFCKFSQGFGKTPQNQNKNHHRSEDRISKFLDTQKFVMIFFLSSSLMNIMTLLRLFPGLWKIAQKLDRRLQLARFKAHKS